MKKIITLFIVLTTSLFGSTLNLCSSCYSLNSNSIESVEKDTPSCPFHANKKMSDTSSDENADNENNICFKCLLTFGELNSPDIHFSIQLNGKQEFAYKVKTFFVPLELATPPPIFS